MEPTAPWSELQAYYGWDLSAADFRAVLEALWEADVAALRPLITAHPELVRADELLQTATRPPGHWHNGHGGVVPEDVARDAQRAAVVRFLVAAGADVNQRSRRRRDTGLHHSARYGLVETARALLDLGVAIDVRARDGATALLRAVRLRYEPVARLLIERGADPHIPDRKGQTAANLAARNGWTL